MKRVFLKVGDTAWFHSSDSLREENDRGLISGKVLQIVNVEGYDEHYVIEISTHIDDYLTIRNPITVSDDPDQPIGMWRR